MILDASVVAKWFLEEEFTETALRLRDEYAEERIDITLPDLLLYEIANVLRYKKYSPEDIGRVMESLFSMELFIVDPSIALLKKAAEIAHSALTA